jgi:hypothetical protein
LRGRKAAGRTAVKLSPSWVGPAMQHLEAVAGLTLHPQQEAGVRPLIFGYLRFNRVVSAARVADMHRQMADYAEREGFALAEVYVDRHDSNDAGFAGLVDALEREVTAQVLVPALDRRAEFAALQHRMRAILERRTGARVLIMHPAPEG